MTEQDYKVQEVVLEIAKETGRSPSQVAINWTVGRTTSALLGARTFEQLEDNMKSLEFELTTDQIERLNKASENSPSMIFPHNFVGTGVDNCRWIYLG